MQTNVLLYFVKYPEPGKVKTRLAKTIGNEAAARAYRGLAESNFLVAKSLSPAAVQTNVVFDPQEREKEIRDWLLDANDYWLQKGEDLGERLRNAFQFAFEKGFKKVMALGSDTLGLRPDLISKGFDALEFYDVVIGPAYDGGYYLIGTHCEQSSIFESIPWSSPRVFGSTLNKLIEKNLSYCLLRKLDDLDEAKNLRGGRTYEIFT